MYYNLLLFKPLFHFLVLPQSLRHADHREYPFLPQPPQIRQAAGPVKKRFDTMVFIHPQQFVRRHLRHEAAQVLVELMEVAVGKKTVGLVKGVCGKGAGVEGVVLRVMDKKEFVPIPVMETKDGARPFEAPEACRVWKCSRGSVCIVRMVK